MYDNFFQQNESNFGQLFQGPWMQGRLVQNGIQFGFAPRATDILKDAKAQLFQAKRFQQDMVTLRKRGAPKSLIDAFQQMGPAEKSNIEAIMKASPTIWDAYIKTWNVLAGFYQANHYEAAQCPISNL